MIQALSSHQVVREARVRPAYESYLTKYFGAPATLGEGPQGFLVEMITPEGVIRPHFHRVDQFQVGMAGGGRMGKHPLQPVAAHYTDSFTPYGPIVASSEGITFYTLRVKSDPGAQYMPGSRDKMERRAGRGITCFTGLTEGKPGRPVDSAVVESPLPPHQDGLAAFTLRVPPGAQVEGPDPRPSGGQYYIVVNGSLLLDGEELPARSLIFVSADETAPWVGAGAAGLEALVVQFPREESTA